ncbi:MAG TPA: O-antigen polymerase [Candidatus Acidoferrales bacterium]|nr:O-antigen polymerase [Candidatus Acidoferrales bacterium]
MSAVTLAPAIVRAPRLRVPTSLWVGAAWAAVALLLRELSVEAFLWASTLGFAVLAIRPFLRPRSLDSGDVMLLFTLYYAMSLLVRGIGVLTWVDSPYLEELGDARSEHLRLLVAWSQFYSGLGLFAVQEGYRSGLAARWAASLEARLPALRSPWRSSRMLPVAVALVAVGVAGAALRVHSLGGFLSAAADPMSAGTDEALGHWWQIALTEFAVVGFHVHMLGLLLRRDRSFLAHYLVLGLGLCVPIYLVSSSKFLLLRTLFVPWLLRHFVVRRVPLGQILAAFAVFGLLFPVLYAYRALGIYNLDAVGLYLQNSDMPLLRVFNRAYGTDSFVLILHRTGTELPFLWGRSLLDLVTFWIPRLLWPGKPDSFGLQFPALYMPDMRWGAMTYVTTSLPGELYLNFHVVGVLVGSALVGVLMRASRLLASRGPGGVLFYAYAYLTAVHLAEGCIASQLETFLTDLVPLLLALGFLVVSLRPAARRVAA